jgi:hypothetical protein
MCVSSGRRGGHNLTSRPEALYGERCHQPGTLSTPAGYLTICCSFCHAVVVTEIEASAGKPNPEAWTDTNGAAALISVSRTAVYDMVKRGTLQRHYAGGTPIFWVAECREVGAALLRVRGKM